MSEDSETQLKLKLLEKHHSKTPQYAAHNKPIKVEKSVKQ